ncbi:MAG: hypothetical protein LBS49_11855 [Candidatus Accumulibacter sp.]|nr:hypothetical protein [Accumulibacter sp.]
MLQSTSGMAGRNGGEESAPLTGAIVPLKGGVSRRSGFSLARRSTTRRCREAGVR